MVLQLVLWAVYGSGNIKASGKIFIGTNSTQEAAASAYELIVDGEGILEEVWVKNSTNWPDYVFKDEYNLMPLEDVAEEIESLGHLPGILSEKQVKDGYAIGEMQKALLEKIEELTLYAIEANKRNKQMQSEINALKSEMSKMKRQF